MNFITFARGGGKSGGKAGAGGIVSAVIGAVTGDGGCGNGTKNGKRGFQPGNKCHGKGDSPVAQASAAHGTARRAISKHVKAGTLNTPAGHAAVRASAKAARTLQAAKAAQKAARGGDAKAKRAVASGRATPLPAKGTPTPAPTPAPTIDRRVAASVREAGVVKAERAAAHLGDLKAGHAAGALTREQAHAHVDRIARGTTKDELFRAARAAGIEHQAATKKALVEHLKATHSGKPAEAKAPAPAPAPVPAKAAAPASQAAPAKAPAKAAESPAPKADRFGKSKAEIIVHDGMEEGHAKVSRTADHLLGGPGASKDIPSLIGATHDANVYFNPASKPGTVEVMASNSKYSATRTIRRGADGKLVIKNDYFEVRPEFQGRGIGSEVFGRQIEQARQMGVGKIETHAARGTGFNGYYTWARLGYDAPLKADFKAGLPPALAGAKRVSDLMRTPEGRTHWKDRGYDLQMTFDLKPGSVSNRVHDAYLAERDARQPKAFSESPTPPDFSRGAGGGDSPDFTEEELLAADAAWDSLGPDEEAAS